MRWSAIRSCRGSSARPGPVARRPARSAALRAVSESTLETTHGPPCRASTSSESIQPNCRRRAWFSRGDKAPGRLSTRRNDIHGEAAKRASSTWVRPHWPRWPAVPPTLLNLIVRWLDGRLVFGSQISAKSDSTKPFAATGTRAAGPGLCSRAVLVGRLSRSASHSPLLTLYVSYIYISYIYLYIFIYIYIYISKP
jgi:hypothetical protein